MATKTLSVSTFSGGLADDNKLGIKGSFYFGEHLNIYDHTSQLTILPKSAKVSSTVVLGLIKWIVDGRPFIDARFAYDDGGRIYKEDSNGDWSLLQTTSSSHGQGLEVFDNYLYYVQDTQVGRYGPLDGSAAFDDDWQTGLNDTSSIGFAPVKAFLTGVVIGHGDQLAYWDGSVFSATTLQFLSNANVRALETLDEFLVIGTFRGTDITDNQDGFLYYWDGASTSFNYFSQVKEGGVAALTTSKGRIFSILGSSGSLFMNYQPFNLVQQLPNVTVNDYVDIYPGAISNYHNRVFIGAAANTNSTSFKHGLYEWGSKGDRYQEVLNYSHTISTGSTTGTTVKIGAVAGFGDDLYFSWRDGSTYGVDKVNRANDPYASAQWESLIFGQVYRDNKATAVKVTHLPLVNGESIEVGYKINRAASYTTTTNSTVGDTETRLPMPVGSDKYREIQLECTLATSGSTSPTVTSISMEFDDLADDKGAF